MRLLGLMLRHWKLLTVNLLLSGSLSIVFVFLAIPVQYCSHVTFIPPVSHGTIISDILYGFTLSDAFKSVVLPSQFQPIVNTSAIRKKIIERFDLYSTYKIENIPNKLGLALARLKKDLDMEYVDAGKLGSSRIVSFTINAYHASPDTSRMIAEYAFRLLDSSISDASIEHGKRKQKYFTERLSMFRRQLDSMQTDFQQFQIQNKAWDITAQIRSDMAEYALIRASILFNEMQSEILSARYGPEHPFVVSLYKDNEVLKKRLESIEKTGCKSSFAPLDSFPQLYMEFIGRQREMFVVKQLILLMSKEKKLAEMKQEHEQSHLMIIDPPYAPDRKARPNRLLACSILTTSCIVFLFGLLVIKQYFPYFRKPIGTVMRRLNRSGIGSMAVIQSAAIAAGVLFAYGLANGLWTLFALLFAAVLIPTMLIFPSAICWIFLLSLFFGKALFNAPTVGVTVTDLIIPILIFAYAGPFLSGKRKTFFANPDTSTIIRSAAVLLAWCIMTILFNLQTYDLKQVLISGWFVYKFLSMLAIMLIAPDIIEALGKKRMLAALMILFLVEVPVAIIQSRMSSGGDFWTNRVTIIGTFTNHHSMLGTMMLIGIALFITAFLDSRNIIWKIACLISVALLFHIIIVSATRSALIALPFAGAAWLLMMSRKKPLQTIVIILAAIAGAYLFFHSSPGSRFIESMFMQGDGSLDESSLSRLFIWEGGIRHFITTGISGKFTGVGIGAYPTIPYPFVLWGGNRFASGGHLNLLHVLLETGVIGLFLFCWLFWVILRSLWRKRTGNSLAFVLFYCTIGLLGSGLFQETFWFQKAFGSMWMFYSLLVSVALYDDRSRTSG